MTRLSLEDHSPPVVHWSLLAILNSLCASRGRLVGCPDRQGKSFGLRESQAPLVFLITLRDQGDALARRLWFSPFFEEDRSAAASPLVFRPTGIYEAADASQLVGAAHRAAQDDGQEQAQLKMQIGSNFISAASIRRTIKFPPPPRLRLLEAEHDGHGAREDGGGAPVQRRAPADLAVVEQTPEAARDQRSRVDLGHRQRVASS